MDEIDIKILEFIQNDAKQSAKEMAAKLALTTTPVYERIKKLESQGIIRQYVALLDANVLNKSLVVFMNITLKEQHSEKRIEFLNRMVNFPVVSELYHTSGTFDFLLKVRFSNIKEFRDFLVNEVSTISNIRNVESHIVLEEIKHSTKILL